MRKLLFIITLLCLIFISGCEVPQTETYITNIKESKYVVTWDEDLTSTLYYINITSDVSSAVTFTTSDTFYDLTSYIDGLLIKNNAFTLTVKVKSNSTTSVYKEEITINVEKEIPPLPVAPIPTNVKIEGTVLSWDNMPNVSEYSVNMFNGTESVVYVTSVNNFDFGELLVESGTYTFKVQSLISKYYSDSSEYSNILEYVYEAIVIEKEIFNYDFTSMDTLISGASVNKFEKYADKSLKLSTSKAYFITPSFKAYKSFSVSAILKGNNCSGNGLITIYGLDENNNVLEKQEFPYTIENSKHELIAEFSNTNIVKIKFEYTTKDKGNVGLYSLVCNHDEEKDKVTKIELINYQDTYVINEQFAYSGILLLTYKSGVKQELKLNELKDQITITNFNTLQKGNYTAEIKYLDLEGKFAYKVVYPYQAIYSYADNINVYTIDINEELNNLFTLISIKKDTTEINVLFDYNKTITLSTYEKLLNELNNYLESDLSYFYSLNNASVFNSLGLEELTNDEYNFAPDVDLILNNNYYEINIYGYNYYFAVNDLDVDHKVDILQLNGNITKDEITSLDPEHIILQEGNIDTFIQNGILVYQTDDEIYQYAPTLNKTFYYSFDKYNFVVEGNNKELSNLTIWSDSETFGLHHNSVENYLYRKSYYGDIENLYGDELVAALRKVIVDTHTYKTSYGEAKTMLAHTDKDPLKPGYIIMTYTKDSIVSTWDQGITWNREHIWPKSLSGGIYTTMSDSTRNAGSDLHHIRPALTSINSSRGNKAYGAITNEQTFYPGDEFIGDTARILFYLSVRYDMSITGLKVCNDISLLLEWNSTDKVDNLERNRNISVQEIQGNFNPFIDNPWIAERIWA